MIKIERNWNANQKISSHLALLFLLLLSFAVAWYTVCTGERIKDNASKSIKTNIEERTKGYLPPVPSQDPK